MANEYMLLSIIKTKMTRIYCNLYSEAFSICNDKGKCREVKVQGNVLHKQKEERERERERERHKLSARERKYSNIC